MRVWSLVAPVSQGCCETQAALCSIEKEQDANAIHTFVPVDTNEMYEIHPIKLVCENVVQTVARHY